jgi:hypothetical protein
MFFSEEKNQKTLAFCAASTIEAMAGKPPLAWKIRVLCFFS